MKTQQVPIRAASEQQESELIDALVLAFSADPVMRWMFPEPHTYLRHFPELALIFGGKAFASGTADYAENFCGAALWLPPGAHLDEDALIMWFQATFPDSKQEVAFDVYDQLDEYKPTEPHWYLPLIGVEPAHQCRGLGSALMEHATAKCDRDGSRAYLEATSPDNIRLYERHGFHVLGTIQEGTMPPLVPMIRDPQSIR